ncbi:inactive peptidyl-prolyl cis-trans isomerase shutdown [Cylas formicarius]|uniref:inactive peptidyl-prolyl cis-trans isomerase shutdown n=1 Tax=Cylas formicarius TaxID=197179 RepID=UPI0029588B9F|nr:inactive peptidyl-prolyl cis-trans isomerase shutdown [Cylas formicarius]
MWKNPINFKHLVEGGTVFEVEPQLEDDLNDDAQQDLEYEKELHKFANLNCIGQFDDEDVYNMSEPFEIIESKMENILEDGGIKKRVLRTGYGETPGDKCIVRVHYNGYIEYKEEPFDSTYVRNKPHQFTVNNGDVLPGLDFAVQSMKITEKSQFMIRPEYGYGKYGCMDRIPANSTVLFEIELLEIIESAAGENYQNLPEEQKKEFENVYKYCISQCVKGKELFGRNIWGAVKEYNKAVSSLEFAQLREYEHQVKQQVLLLKLYSNLLVCYTKLGEPKKGCINFNKINALTQGTDLKISSKVYFNNAKCLRMLENYDLAKKRLQMAFSLEPRNPEILEEIKTIDAEQKNYLEKQAKMGRALLQQ